MTSLWSDFHLSTLIKSFITSKLLGGTFRNKELLCCKSKGRARWNVSALSSLWERARLQRHPGGTDAILSLHPGDPQKGYEDLILPGICRSMRGNNSTLITGSDRFHCWSVIFLTSFCSLWGGCGLLAVMRLKRRWRNQTVVFAVPSPSRQRRWGVGSARGRETHQPRSTGKLFCKLPQMHHALKGKTKLWALRRRTRRLYGTKWISKLLSTTQKHKTATKSTLEMLDRYPGASDRCVNYPLTVMGPVK